MGTIYFVDLRKKCFNLFHDGYLISWFYERSVNKPIDNLYFLEHLYLCSSVPNKSMKIGIPYVITNPQYPLLNLNKTKLRKEIGLVSQKIA